MTKASRSKDVTSVSHDEVMTLKLRDNPRFASEYLKAALEDTDESGVLQIALSRVMKAGRLASRTSGTAGRKLKEEEFLRLAERFRTATDPEQIKQLSDQLGRFVLGE
jgi:hypothetical protein